MATGAESREPVEACCMVVVHVWSTRDAAPSTSPE